MKSGEKMEEMFPFWYGGGEPYDELCEEFQDVIRAVGQGDLGNNEAEWQKSVDGKMAQLLLCDQLSRNAFRGKEEAFAYDDTAVDIAKELSKGLMEVKSEKSELAIPNLSGDCYLPYLQFIISPLMHSETPEDHELAMEVADYSVELAPSHLKEAFQRTRALEIEHKEVIDTFGRYPHRNNKRGRASTPEELQWLANEDELPGWAKSQG